MKTRIIDLIKQIDIRCLGLSMARRLVYQSAACVDNKVISDVEAVVDIIVGSEVRIGKQVFIVTKEIIYALPPPFGC